MLDALHGIQRSERHHLKQREAEPQDEGFAGKERPARSLRTARVAAHSEVAATDAVSAEHPSSIGRRKVFPKSTTDEDDIRGTRSSQKVSPMVAD